MTNNPIWRINDIEKWLSELDDKVTVLYMQKGIGEDLSKAEQDINKLSLEIIAIKRAQENNSKIINELEHTVKSLNSIIDDYVKVLHAERASTESLLRDLKAWGVWE